MASPWRNLSYSEVFLFLRIHVHTWRTRGRYYILRYPIFDQQKTHARTRVRTFDMIWWHEASIIGYVFQTVGPHFDSELKKGIGLTWPFDFVGPQRWDYWEDFPLISPFELRYTSPPAWDQGTTGLRQFMLVAIVGWWFHFPRGGCLSISIRDKQENVHNIVFFLWLTFSSVFKSHCSAGVDCNFTKMYTACWCKKHTHTRTAICTANQL